MDITGASGAISRSDNKRMTAHAMLFYEEIRKRASDVAAIAANTNFRTADIELI
jgi:hypothetical protein